MAACTRRPSACEPAERTRHRRAWFPLALALALFAPSASSADGSGDSATLATDSAAPRFEVEGPAGGPVHQWIACQAVANLSSGALKNEIQQYTGGANCEHPVFDDPDGDVPSAWKSDQDSWSKASDALLEGTWEEDQGLAYSRVRDHFWNPDGGYDDGLDVPGSRSALEAGADYFERSVAAYVKDGTTARPTAYWWLGRVAHLVGDMGSPAHVHENWHVHRGFDLENDHAYTGYRPKDRPAIYKTWTAAHPATDLPSLAALPPYAPGPPDSDPAVVKVFANLARASRRLDSDDVPGTADIGRFNSWPGRVELAGTVSRIDSVLWYRATNRGNITGITPVPVVLGAAAPDAAGYELDVGEGEYNSRTIHKPSLYFYANLQSRFDEKSTFLEAEYDVLVVRYVDEDGVVHDGSAARFDSIDDSVFGYSIVPGSVIDRRDIFPKAIGSASRLFEAFWDRVAPTNVPSGATVQSAVHATKWRYHTIDVPAGAETLEVRATPNTNAELWLHLRRGGYPHHDDRDRDWDCLSLSPREPCIVRRPVAGRWTIGALAGGADVSYTLTARHTSTTAAALAAPVLVSPADGGTGQSTAPRLVWNAVPGATSYRVVLGTERDGLPSDPARTTGRNLVLNQTMASTSFDVPPGLLERGRRYHWTVRARNDTEPGAWSTPFAFDTATACETTVSASPSVFGAGGGSGKLRVATARGCAWTASSEASWITLTGRSSGSGPDEIPFVVAATGSSSTRSGAIVVGAQSAAIVQHGAGSGSLSNVFTVDTRDHGPRVREQGSGLSPRFAVDTREFGQTGDEYGAALSNRFTIDNRYSGHRVSERGEAESGLFAVDTRPAVLAPCNRTDQAMSGPLLLNIRSDSEGPLGFVGSSTSAVFRVDARVPGVICGRPGNSTDSDVSVGFVSTGTTVTEGGAAGVDVLVELSVRDGRALSRSLTVEVSIDAASTASPGADYQANAKTRLTFPSGAKSGRRESVRVAILDDSQVEKSETVLLRLTAVSGSAAITTGLHPVAILDDDGAQGPGRLSGRVVAAATGLPLAGCTVRLGTETRTTVADGAFDFRDVPAGEYLLEVTRSGYASFVETALVEAGASRVTTVQLRTGGGSGQVRITDLRSTYSTRDRRAWFLEAPYDDLSVRDTFVATVDWGGHPPGDVVFRGRETWPTRDGRLLIVPGKDLAPGGSLVAVARSSDGASSAPVIANVAVMPKLADGVMRLLYARTWGNSFGYSARLNVGLPVFDRIQAGAGGGVPASIPFFGGKSWDLSTLLEVEGALDGTDLRLAADVRLPVRKRPNLVGMHVALHADLAARASYADASRRWSSSGDLRMKVQASTTVLGPAYLFGPFYGKLGASFSATTAGLTFTNLGDGSRDYGLLGRWTLGPELQGILGAGLSGVLSGEVVATGSLLAEATMPGAGSTFMSALDLSVAIERRWTVFGFQTPMFPGWGPTGIRYTCNLMAESNACRSEQRSMRSASVPELLPRDYELRPVDRLFTGSGSFPRSVGSDPAEVTLAADVYPQSRPRTDGRNGQAGLVLLFDDPVRSSMNRTSVIASRWSGSGWTPPSALDDDGSPDFQPTISVDGDGSAIAAWVDASMPLDATATLAELSATLDISVADFDGTSWSVPHALTSDDILDHSPEAVLGADGTAVVAWIANEAGNILGSAEAPNQVRVARREAGSWGEPATIALLPKAIVKMALARAGAAEHIVLAVDEDADLATVGDQELYLLSANAGIWQAPARLTNDAVVDANPQVAVFDSGQLRLAWIRDGSIVVASGLDPSTAQVVAEPGYTLGSADFRLAALSSGRLAVLWQDLSEDGTDVFGVFFDPESGTWTPPRRVTSGSGMERDLSFVFVDASRLVGVYNRVEVQDASEMVRLSGGRTVPVHRARLGATDLASMVLPVESDVVELGRDLALDAATLVQSPPNPAPGAAASTIVEVRNLGETTESGIVVTLVSRDEAGDSQLAEATLPNPLAPGASAVVQLDWTVPADTSGPLDLMLEVDAPSQEEDRDPSNDTLPFRAVVPGPGISGVEVVAVGPLGRSIVVHVENEGVLPMEGVRLELTAENQSAPIADLEVPDLGAHEAADVEFLWELPQQESGQIQARAALLLPEAGLDFDETDNEAAFLIDASIDSDGDGVADSADCEPDDASVSPLAPEICNGVDDDCDGNVDGSDPDLAPCPVDDDFCSADTCIGGSCGSPVDCSDGVFCNGQEHCESGVGCQAASVPVDCGPVAPPCMIGICDAVLDACVFEPVEDGAPCSDGVYCNGLDQCFGGVCSLHAGDPCAGPDGDQDCAESCDEASADCQAADPEGSHCEDGLFCTEGETCSAAVCGSGAVRTCDDEDACTVDACDDDPPHCVNVPGPSCDDRDVCTDDSCDPGIGCVHTPVPGCMVTTTLVTTTTLGMTTTSSSTTTTMEDPVLCGDADGNGKLQAADALRVLKKAVGQDLPCPLRACDVDNDTFVRASDALRVLRRAVGQAVDMVCPLAG